MIVQYVFQKAYTNTKFLEVKAKCDVLKLVSESKTASLGGLSLYQTIEKFPKPVWKKRWKTFIVSCDKDKGDFSYSCKLFEFRGILCRHIIKIIEFEDINVIPERYILSRWRKDIVRPYENIRVSYYDLEEFDRVKRVRELSQRHCYLSSLALHGDETFLMYKEATNDVRAMLEEALGIERTGGEGGGWWDPSVRKVYGRRRIRPKDQNQRHLTKNAAPQPEGGTKDPVDKRHNGRGTKNRKPHPSEKGAKAKKRKNGREDHNREEEDNCINYTPPQTQHDGVQMDTYPHLQASVGNGDPINYGDTPSCSFDMCNITTSPILHPYWSGNN
ncbi:Protein FAR-RED ELONGATED HYPOCOTYL 3 [Bienertia sinuspersici]